MTDLSRTEAYDYELDPAQIARYPTRRRDESRLLAVRRGSGAGEVAGGAAGMRDLRFRELPALVPEGDLLVVNESRVLPVRLLGRKPTGAACEVLLLRPLDAGSFSGARRFAALVRPGAKLGTGRRIIVAGDLSLVVEARTGDGGRIVRIESPRPAGELIEAYGRVPLPPYLGRGEEPLDRERYQTVYARRPGSVAAPTAGLHFTPELLGELGRRGVALARLTLHVGPGTFRPVATESVDGHGMHAESWELSPKAAEAVAETRARGGRVWAVGTTVVRALESAARGGGLVRSGRGTTELFIRPGYVFRVVDGVITNFHLPRSTLLMLVTAFAGYETTMRAYCHAARSGYRFYSYGDAMAIVASRVRGTP